MILSSLSKLFYESFLVSFRLVFLDSKLLQRINLKEKSFSFRNRFKTISEQTCVS